MLASRQSRYVLGVVALGALYYGAAHLGYAFQFAGPVAAIVWLPVGVGIAFLYFAGLQFWPGVVIGDLLVNNYASLPLGSALGQSVGNVLEVVVAAALLRRLPRRSMPLESVSGVARVIVAIAVGTTISATVGVLSLSAGGVIHHSTLGVWRTWWLGDASGALIVVPVALAWYRRSSLTWIRGRGFELGSLALVTAALALVVMNNSRPLSYIVFPALIWAALRLGPRGATLAVTIVSAFAIWGTTHYAGPFVFHSITRMVVQTQLFLGVAALSALTLAAVVSEREALGERLDESRARMLNAAHGERRRLERNLHDGAQQRLVALAARLRLGAIESQETPSHAPELFEGAQEELLVALDELRTLAHGIHPSMLARLGLAGALHDISLSSSIPVEIIGAPSTRLDDAVEATAYFVVTEAIANAEKYSRASRIQVRFEMRPRLLLVEVSDNGVGGAVERTGHGLDGLRVRVEGIGGSMQMDSPPTGGTRVAAAVPLGSAVAH